jgi:hypothetical protein
MKQPTTVLCPPTHQKLSPSLGCCQIIFKSSYIYLKKNKIELPHQSISDYSFILTSIVEIHTSFVLRVSINGKKTELAEVHFAHCIIPPFHVYLIMAHPTPLVHGNFMHIFFFVIYRHKSQRCFTMMLFD